jgi:ribosome-associated toxin RatA of RatAB toxin-antitoxin module
MHSTISMEIAAAPDLVFRLARGVGRWERLLPHYARSRLVERRADGALVVDFVARRPIVEVLGLGLPVAWRARTWNEPDTMRLRFVHVAGATRGMDVTWRIEASPAGCLVSIDHDFRPRLPGFAAFVDRWFTRPIAGRTLATFKALAEAIRESDASSAREDAGGGGVGGSAVSGRPPRPTESDRPAATNPRV